MAREVQLVAVTHLPWWTGAVIAVGKLNLLLGLPVSPDALAALIVRHTKVDVVEKEI